MCVRVSPSVCMCLDVCVRVESSRSEYWPACHHFQRQVHLHTKRYIRTSSSSFSYSPNTLQTHVASQHGRDQLIVGSVHAGAVAIEQACCAVLGQWNTTQWSVYTFVCTSLHRMRVPPTDEVLRIATASHRHNLCIPTSSMRYVLVQLYKILD